MQNVEEKIESMCKDYPSPKSKRFHIILFSVLGVISIALALAIILPLTITLIR